MSSVFSSSGDGSGSVTIPELYADPISPAPQSAWVLHTPSDVGGEPIGLLLALTYTIGAGTYVFSYKTIEGLIVRANLVFE